MPKQARIIGTSPAAIEKAEQELGKTLPMTFRTWLLKNNGLSIDGIHVYPVYDERDPRKTWESIVRNYERGWPAWLETFEDESRDFSALLPFADFGTGDYYCFDYSRLGNLGEPVVVLFSHETGETSIRGESFEDFEKRALKGEFEYD